MISYIEKLNIVVIGYYGKLNYGDDLLQHSITELFKEHNLLFTSWFPGIDLLNQADLVVVGGGSIWPGNTIFQHGKEISKRLRTPIIFLGISAKNEDTRIQENTKYLVDKSLYFHVRDEESKEIINQEKIVKGTDLYWWSNHQLPKIDLDNAKNILINFRSWDAESWNAKVLFSEIANNHDNLTAFPLFFGSARHESSGSIDDAELLSLLGMNNVPKSMDLYSLTESKLVISMRFHGLLIGMRAGIPTIGFDYHKKTKNLFIDNGIEELCCSLSNPQSIKNAIANTEENLSIYREKFKVIKNNYLTEGNSDKLRFMDHMKNVEISPKQNTKSLLKKIKSQVKKLLY
ncbi:polysaccharide pyruvyl transferase family protein [Aestuariicella sp. G3-2]|uniref:polysaccharide pyruvyl transferase family protein n=1 Tax=Pseudomaricurvus albidus TaxID=2842452 RepID=UPI001C0C101F|nr:polysaccharide pyruvyl transferase family protein [Aestuariicella albida]MBU3070890.1 polysaccharide pyruvyl transferase family protein [Aestuariicella albida]